jgi:Papain family cysteine protease
VAVELTAIPDARRSKETGNDYSAADANLGDAALPESVDLRRPWHPIADQGETASCVGWAVADSVLRWHLVESGRLEPDQRLSPRHVWMSAKETDQRDEYPSTFLEQDGTSLKSGLDVVRKFGVALESELPWEGHLATVPPETFNRSARRRRIMAYYNLGDDTVEDGASRIPEWRKWLHRSGPVLVLVRQDKHFRAATGALESFDTASVEGSHAAALVGYDAGHFLLRSSWGTDWGDAGYVRMSLEYTAQAVIESYGVMV